MSDYAGAGPVAADIKGNVSTNYPAPEPGTWEIVVYSSATLSLYDLTSSNYQLNIALKGVPEPGPSNFKDKYLITCQASEQEKERGFITLQARERHSKKPVSGLLEINGQAYEIQNGKLILPVQFNEKPAELKVTLWEGDYLKVRN
jgi:hypothetical protein